MVKNFTVKSIDNFDQQKFPSIKSAGKSDQKV